MKANTSFSGLFKQVATSATLPLVLTVGMAASADTVTTNGVTWTYTSKDTTKKTVTLGGIAGFDENVTPNDSQRAMPAATEIDASLIPWTFDVNGETYTVTALGSQAFRGCTNLTGNLSIPRAVTSIGRACFDSTKVRIVSLGGVTQLSSYLFQRMPAQPFPDISDVTSLKSSFYGCPFTGVAKVAKNANSSSWRSFSHCAGLEAVLALGPDTVTSGTQAYTTFSVDEFFDQSKKLKIIFMGPNTKGTSFAQVDALNGVTGCKMFVPDNGFWDGFNPSATGNEIIYYGATTNLDFTVEDDASRIVAKPTTEAALLKVIESAPLFKKYFGWNTIVEMPNDLALSAGTLTAGMFTGLEANSLVLMFSVTTQAKADSILAAVPAEATVGVDPTGLTERITMPRYENVFVKSAPGVEVRRTDIGFVILVL